jgi:hypothetical protein
LTVDPSGLWIAAQADPVLFAQYGILGIVVIGFVSGWLWAKPSVDRLQRDLDVAIQRLDERNRFDREVVVPAITSNSNQLEEVAEVIKANADVMKRCIDHMDKEDRRRRSTP